ncbi:MAG: hypothetical protein RLZZ127_801, partial [Planctomycetota bacterium]
IVAATERVDLEQAGDFIVWAATLLEIKARAVAPVDDPVARSHNPEEILDPRADLVRRLLEYRAFKEASFLLVGCEERWRGRHERRLRELIPDDGAAAEALDLGEIDTWTLCRTWEDILQRINGMAPRTVVVDDLPMERRLQMVLESVRARGEGTLEELFAVEPSRLVRTSIVLALLEGARQRFIELGQAEQFGTIRFRLRGDDERIPPEGQKLDPEPLPRLRKALPLVTYRSEPGAVTAGGDDDDDGPVIETEDQRFARELEEQTRVDTLLRLAADVDAAYVAWIEAEKPHLLEKVRPPPPPEPAAVAVADLIRVPVANAEPVAVAIAEPVPVANTEPVAVAERETGPTPTVADAEAPIAPEATLPVEPVPAVSLPAAVSAVAEPGEPPSPIADVVAASPVPDGAGSAPEVADTGTVPAIAIMMAVDAAAEPVAPVAAPVADPEPEPHGIVAGSEAGSASASVVSDPPVAAEVTAGSEAAPMPDGVPAAVFEEHPAEAPLAAQATAQTPLAEPCQPAAEPCQPAAEPEPVATLASGPDAMDPAPVPSSVPVAADAVEGCPVEPSLPAVATDPVVADAGPEPHPSADIRAACEPDPVPRDAERSTDADLPPASADAVEVPIDATPAVAVAPVSAAVPVVPAADPPGGSATTCPSAAVDGDACGDSPAPADGSGPAAGSAPDHHEAAPDPAPLPEVPPGAEMSGTEPGAVADAVAALPTPPASAAAQVQEPAPSAIAAQDPPPNDPDPASPGSLSARRRMWSQGELEPEDHAPVTVAIGLRALPAVPEPLEVEAAPGVDPADTLPEPMASHLADPEPHPAAPGTAPLIARHRTENPDDMLRLRHLKPLAAWLVLGNAIAWGAWAAWAHRPAEVLDAVVDGPLAGDGALTVTFNLPLWRESPPAEPALTLIPPVPGTWTWVGATRARFAPAAPWPLGATIAVAAGEDLATEDGFRAARGSLAEVPVAAPSPSTVRLRQTGSTADWELRFPVAVDPVAVLRALRIDGRGAVVVDTPAADVVVVRAFVARPSVRMELLAPFAWSAEVPAAPIQAAVAADARAGVDGAAILVRTERPADAALAAAVRTEPPVAAAARVVPGGIELRGPFRAGATYAVRVPARVDAEDPVAGVRPGTVIAAVPAPAPGIRIEDAGPGRIRIVATGADRIRLRWRDPRQPPWLQAFPRIRTLPLVDGTLDLDLALLDLPDGVTDAALDAVAGHRTVATRPLRLASRSIGAARLTVPAPAPGPAVPR